MPLIAPVTNTDLPEVVSSKDSIFTTADGKSILDGCSGAISCTIGHGNERVIDAMERQARLLCFAYRTQFKSRSSERLAERLCEKLRYDAAFFVNSGSEAIEAATRLAVQYWQERGQPQKNVVLSRKVSYHGSTNAAMSLSGHWPRRRSIPTLSGRPTIPTPYCFRCPFGLRRDTCQMQCASALEIEIGELGASSVAALVVEPITGASGAAIVPPDGYLKAIAEICRRYDVLLIVDEVLTGLGRTGNWLEQDNQEVHADIVCLGKGLNSGYWPISGILFKSKIAEAIKVGSGRFGYGHTHSNHPVGAAVANAVIDVVEDDDLIQRSVVQGEKILDFLRTNVAASPLVGDVRGRGSLWGIELVRPGTLCETFSPQDNAAGKVVSEAYSRGLNLYPASGFAAQHHGDAVIFAPPLTTSAGDLQRMMEIFSETIQACEVEW